MNDIQLTETACLILSTMRKPIHGYDIMKKVEDSLSPMFSIGPATMYTTLAKLMKHGLCTINEEQNRKMYTLTQLGENVLNEEIQRRERLLAFMIQQQGEQQ